MRPTVGSQYRQTFAERAQRQLVPVRGQRSDVGRAGTREGELGQFRRLVEPSAEEPTLAERLCDRYEAIETITCAIRKTTRSPESTVRMLSRVHYRRPDHIHVENVSPVKRRIIADGNVGNAGGGIIGWAPGSAKPTETAGGDQPHNNISPMIGMNAIIRY